MLKAGSETGSLMNHVMSGDTTEPKVGMGCTILCWTDFYQHAGTIIRVTPSQVHVQLDHANRTDCRGFSEQQDWAYSPNPDGGIEIFRKTKRGYRNRAGNGLLIGTRDHYYDFGF